MTLHLRIAALTALFACAPEEAVVLLTIGDPTQRAAGADSIEISSGFQVVGERRAIPRGFPLTAALTSNARRGQIYVTAYQDDRPVARGATETEVTFEPGTINDAFIVLSDICRLSSDCDDGEFCNGLESCIDSVCRAGRSPCEPNLDCVDLVCDEGRDWCLITLDPALSEPDPCSFYACDRSSTEVIDNVELRGLACQVDNSTEERVCRDGVCELSTCGDGVLDPRTELCDEPDGDCLTCSLDLRNASRPSFDPIGRWLTFQSTNPKYSVEAHRPIIMMFDPETGDLIGTDRIFPAALIEDTAPQIGGNIVAFNRRDPSGTRTTFFDISTGELTTIVDALGQVTSLLESRLTPDGGSLVRPAIDFSSGLVGIQVLRVPTEEFQNTPFEEAQIFVRLDPSSGAERVMIHYFDVDAVESLAVLDTVTGERRGLTIDGGVQSMSLSADGRVAAYVTQRAGFNVLVTDLDTGEQSQLDFGRIAIANVDTSSTGRFILWSRTDPPEIVRYDRSTDSYQTASGLGEVAISSDGERYAVASDDRIVLGEF